MFLRLQLGYGEQEVELFKLVVSREPSEVQDDVGDENRRLAKAAVARRFACR